MAITELKLQSGQAFFDWSDAPAFVGWQVLDWIDAFILVVQWANVPQFNEFATFIFIEPPQWQALSPADIGSVRIDPTGAVLIQECTRPNWMRCRGCQKVAMSVSYVLRFHFEHRQIVCAAHAATATADKTFLVDLRKLVRTNVNLAIERVQHLQRLFNINQDQVPVIRSSMEARQPSEVPPRMAAAF